MPKQLLALISFYFFFFVFSNHAGKQSNLAFASTVKIDTLHTSTKNIKDCLHPEAVDFLGIDVEKLSIKEKTFGKRDNLQKLFQTLKLDKHQYAQFIEDAKEYSDFSNATSIKKYFTITKETDSASLLQYLILKVSDYEYVIANCTDTSTILYNPIKNEEVLEQASKKSSKRKHTKKTAAVKPVYFHPIQVSLFEKQLDTTKIKFAAVIEQSLAKTFKEHHIDTKIIETLNKAYNGKFNVNSLRKGDTIQFIYNQLSINGRFLENGHVEAICSKTKKKAYYAVDYFVEEDSSYQYTDEKGNYLKTAFLKSPLQKGGRIASKYSLNRFHPVLQIEKAHLGTDFAAPQGSPIIATASGIISAAQFTQNNGNYIKIRHDKVYETQYLHMCRFARGIRNGTRVQQGQVIGYVGCTGLATGPHVCYRFWKRGAQVDPLREKLNVIKQIAKYQLPEFERYFSQKKLGLNNIPFV
ncbi:MAG: hypothetical protein RJA25_1689 [Bacteroidota bacterium]|jgi:murein DD-endopeptidase MepM/ murein hydrolase activator NlpD